MLLPAQSSQAVVRINRRHAPPPIDLHDWLGPSFDGAFKLRRTFRWPTPLSEVRSVDLVAQVAGFDGEVQLNSRHLGDLRAESADCRFNITTRLLPSNEIVFILQPNTRPPELKSTLFSVCLEIESVDS